MRAPYRRLLVFGEEVLRLFGVGPLFRDFVQRSQATRADIDADLARRELQLLLMRIRPERAVGARRFALPAPRVMMADISTKHGVLAAHLAFATGHELFSPLT